MLLEITCLAMRLAVKSSIELQLVPQSRVQQLTKDIEVIENFLKNSSTVELQLSRHNDWRKWIHTNSQSHTFIKEDSLNNITLEDKPSKDKEVGSSSSLKLPNREVARIEGVMISNPTIWIVLGDYNVVRSSNEWDGSIFDQEWSLNFGPKPFKVFEHWNWDKDLNEITKAPWASDIMTNGMNEKQSAKKQLIYKNLKNWDAKAEIGELYMRDVDKRKEWQVELHSIEQVEREALKSKSRIRQPIEGDENSCFFTQL
ncbi:hypothetical protein Tco_1243953 [Tanacetum coccineum]